MPLTLATQNVIRGIVPDGTTGISAGNFIVGSQYEITSLGTTTQAQWNTIAGTSGATYVVGSFFTAVTTGASLGTGQAALARTLEKRFRDVINVKDFGAVGDGVADDTIAIINAIGSGYRTVFFPGGTYIISDTITIDKPGVILVGEHKGSVIKLNDPVKDIIHFKPPVGSTGEISFGGLYDITLYNTNLSTGTVSNPRTGAGLKLTRASFFTFSNILIRDCPDGLWVAGGQANIYDKITLWPIGNSIPGVILRPKSSQMTFTGFLQDGRYYHCNNQRIQTYSVDAFGYEYAIKIKSSDGVMFTSGGTGRSTKAAVLIDVDTNAGVTTGLNPYVGVLKFSNGYFDSVENVNGTEYNFYVPQNTVGSHRRIYSVTLENITIANSQKNSFYAEEPIYNLLINACDIQGNAESAIVLTNATDLPGRSNFAKTVISNNSFAFNNTDDNPNNSQIDFAYQNSINIIGNNFGDTKQCGIRARSTNNVISITGNTFSGLDTTWSDLVKESGFFTFTPYVVAGNSSESTTVSNILNGLRVGNKTVSDTSTLDWYEEQTLTPQLLINSNATGITQSSSSSGLFATRSGNFVNFTLRVVLTSKGVNTGNVSITGLPYTTNNLGRTACAVSIAGIDSTITQQIMAELVFDATTGQRDIFLFKQSAGTRVNLTDADIKNFTDISIAGNYRV